MLYIQSRKNTRTLLKNDVAIGTLTFPKWHSSNAVLEIGQEKLELTQKSFWSSSYHVLKKGFSLGEIKMNWKGYIKIHLKDFNKRIREFTIKHRGVFKSRYEVVDERDNVIMTLFPEGSWNQMRYDYRIETSAGESDNVELLGLYACFIIDLSIIHAAAG
ncbi:MAG: hypothetical protein RIC35_14755 [Marinoscillum sp.]